MQDRVNQVDETSCNARPDHTVGSKADISQALLNHLARDDFNRSDATGGNIGNHVLNFYWRTRSHENLKA